MKKFLSLWSLNKLRGSKGKFAKEFFVIRVNNKEIFDI